MVTGQRFRPACAWRQPFEVQRFSVKNDFLPASHRARNRLLVEIEDELWPHLVSLHRQGIHADFSTKIKTPEEAQSFTPLYLDLTQDAIILYDQGGFFQTILDQLAERLRALGAQRVRQGRVRYWKLKPDYQWGEVIEI